MSERMNECENANALPIKDNSNTFYEWAEWAMDGEWWRYNIYCCQEGAILNILAIYILI